MSRTDPADRAGSARLGEAGEAVDALAELRTAYRDRAAPVRRRAAGTPVVGYVGADVPVELVTAVGALPVRLAGNPARDRTEADRYLGTGLDPASRSILAGLLTGDQHLDLLLVSNDCEASLRLFYTVGELRRLGMHTALPTVHLVDLLHLPYRTTTRYNHRRLTETLELLRRWSGRPVGEAELAASVRRHDRARSLMLRLRDLRTADPPLLRGTDALAVLGAGTVLPVDDYAALLGRLLDGAAELPRHDGVRLQLTGSSHDGPGVYEALEGAGYVVVADDHDFGDALAEPLVGETPPDEPPDAPPVGAPPVSATLGALAERYQYRGPTAARSSVRARARQAAAIAARSRPDLLVGYVRDGYEAPAWDFAAQRAALAETGVPAVLLAHRRYGELGEDALPLIAGALAAGALAREAG